MINSYLSLCATFCPLVEHFRIFLLSLVLRSFTVTCLGGEQYSEGPFNLSPWEKLLLLRIPCAGYFLFIPHTEPFSTLALCPSVPRRLDEPLLAGFQLDVVNGRNSQEGGNERRVGIPLATSYFNAESMVMVSCIQTMAAHGGPFLSHSPLAQMTWFSSLVPLAVGW